MEPTVVGRKNNERIVPHAPLVQNTLDTPAHTRAREETKKKKKEKMKEKKKVTVCESKYTMSACVCVHNKKTDYSKWRTPCLRQ